MRFLDLLRECPELNGIQWNPQPQHKLGSWMEALRAIRERGFCLYVGCQGQLEAAEAVARELGPDGLFLDLGDFPSEDTARAAMERVERAGKR